MNSPNMQRIPKLRTDHLPEQMVEPFHALGNRLTDLIASNTVYYQPNHGNWGDGLIAAGTRRFLSDLGIEYQEHRYRGLKNPRWLRKPAWLRTASRHDSVLLYGGGGAWCSYWDRSDYLSYIARFFRHVIVLPSTFERIVNIPNATFFCRDLYESRQLSNADFCHDMAFYLDPGESRGGQGTANMFRTDLESAKHIPLPDGNRDLSLEQRYDYPPDEFFDALRPYEEIRTDRLHVCIASCLLGKKVHLHPGAYFKNRAVFDSSIRGNFANASFAQELPV